MGAHGGVQYPQRLAVSTIAAVEIARVRRRVTETGCAERVSKPKLESAVQGR